jgi:hypothetical protein
MTDAIIITDVWKCGGSPVGSKNKRKKSRIHYITPSPIRKVRTKNLFTLVICNIRISSIRKGRGIFFPEYVHTIYIICK